MKEIIVETQSQSARGFGERESCFFPSIRFTWRPFVAKPRFAVDEPPALGGSDPGPNPVELVLAALRTCREITSRAYATALGGPSTASRSSSTAFSTCGIFAGDERVRPSFARVQEP